MSGKIDLVKYIKENPNCKFIVDNDGWWVEPDNELGEEISVGDGNVIPRGDDYGSGNCYGGDILQALAEIVGVTVESV